MTTRSIDAPGTFIASQQYEKLRATAHLSAGVSIAALVILVAVLALAIVTVAFLFTAKRQASDAVTDVKRRAADIVADVKRTTQSVRQLTDTVNKSETAATLLELPSTLAALKALFGGASAARK
jgi:uncharacterized protein YlxW (UPF0749 family)